AGEVVGPERPGGGADVVLGVVLEGGDVGLEKCVGAQLLVVEERPAALLRVEQDVDVAGPAALAGVAAGAAAVALVVAAAGEPDHAALLRVGHLGSADVEAGEQVGARAGG